jgi:hypothetical protein
VLLCSRRCHHRDFDRVPVGQHAHTQRGADDGSVRSGGRGSRLMRGLQSRATATAFVWQLIDSWPVGASCHTCLAVLLTSLPAVIRNYFTECDRIWWDRRGGGSLTLWGGIFGSKKSVRFALQGLWTDHLLGRLTELNAVPLSDGRRLNRMRVGETIHQRIEPATLGSVPVEFPQKRPRQTGVVPLTEGAPRLLSTSTSTRSWHCSTPSRSRVACSVQPQPVASPQSMTGI